MKISLRRCKGGSFESKGEKAKGEVGKRKSENQNPDSYQDDLGLLT